MKRKTGARSVARVSRDWGVWKREERKEERGRMRCGCRPQALSPKSLSSLVCQKSASLLVWGRKDPKEGENHPS